MGESSSIPSEQAGVLVEKDIRDQLLVLMEDEEDRCFKSASYDLRLGNEYLEPGKFRVGFGDTPEVLYCTDNKDNAIVIRPFSSVIVSTYEIVRLPNNIIGKFNLRIKQAMRGLIVQMGTQVEPCYQGRLFALLQNITDREVSLRYKDYDTRPFTIEFYYTNSAAQVNERDKKSIMSFLDKDFNQIRISGKTLDGIISHKQQQIREIEAKVISATSELNVKAEFRRNIALSVVLILCLTVIAPILLTIFFSWSPLNWNGAYMERNREDTEFAKKSAEASKIAVEKMGERIGHLETELETLKSRTNRFRSKFTTPPTGAR